MYVLHKLMDSCRANGARAGKYRKHLDSRAAGKFECKSVMRVCVHTHTYVDQWKFLLVPFKVM